MPIFGGPQPFDADVEKATSEMNTQDDWAMIMDLCDKVTRTTNGSRDCLKALMKRVQNKIPHVCLQALTVLDACVSNCGKVFHLEIASRDFMLDVKNILSNKNTHPKVRHKLKALIKKWAEMNEFKNDASLNLLVALNRGFKDDGADISDTDVSSPARRVDPADVRKEEDDIAKAIELSLQEEKSHPKMTTQAPSLYPTMGMGAYPLQLHAIELSLQQEKSHPKTTAQAPSLYPTMGMGAYTAPNTSQYSSSPASSAAYNYTQSDTRNVRALYDFEAAEDNELTFKAGEIVTVLDDSDPNWWKGYNQRGEGLFPANFVSADLSVEVEDSERRKVQFNESVEVKTLPAAPEVVEISEGKINECLQLIENADPTGENRPDTDEMLILEEQCKAMGPLIDAELEKIDTKHANLVGMNSKVMEALQMYHMLMREGYGIPKPGPLVSNIPTQPPPPQMFTQMAQPPPDASLPQAPPGSLPPQGQIPPPGPLPQQSYQHPPQPSQQPPNQNFQDTNVNNMAAGPPLPHQYHPAQYPNPGPHHGNITTYSTIQTPYVTSGVHPTPNMYHQPLI